MSNLNTKKSSNKHISNSPDYPPNKNTASYPSYESLNCSESYKRNRNNIFSISGTISTYSSASDEVFGETVVDDNGRISLAYENLQMIPKQITDKYAQHARVLDISYNNFENLSFLSFFEELHTLILDRNPQLNVTTLPSMPELKILWINNCNVSNIKDWIYRIKEKCPSLEQLSIMGNPGTGKNFAYPQQLTNAYFIELTQNKTNSDYRQFVLDELPNLKFLDGIATCSNITKKRTHKENSESSSISTDTSSPPRRFYKSSEQKSCHIFLDTGSLKDLFKMRKRANSYQSSSTN